MSGPVRSECRSTAKRLEKRRESRLSAAAAADLDGHLAECRECREDAAATEPLALFKGLVHGPAPEHVRSFILGGFRAVETESPRRRSLGDLWSLVLWEPAPALAALLLVGVLLLAWAGGSMTPAPVAEPWLREGSMTNAVAAVEEIRSPTAEVFAFSLDDAAGPTEVILIVDRSIDL